MSPSCKHQSAMSRPLLTIYATGNVLSCGLKGMVMGGSPETPREVADEIVRLYKDDQIGGKLIAQRVGVGVSTVYSVLKRAGIGRSASSRLAMQSSAPNQTVAELYSQGLSGPEIAASLGIARSV